MNPSPEHERRRELLACLAILAGCTRGVPAFPDGLMPDVLRIRLGNDLLFVGDAKATETAGCAATAARLDAYFTWIQVHAATGRAAVVALCHSASAGTSWRPLLSQLIESRDLSIVRFEVAQLTPSDTVTWATLLPAARDGRSRLGSLTRAHLGQHD
jgi:hypothetical protein